MGNNNLKQAEQILSSNSKQKKTISELFSHLVLNQVEDLSFSANESLNSSFSSKEDESQNHIHKDTFVDFFKENQNFGLYLFEKLKNDCKRVTIENFEYFCNLEINPSSKINQDKK